MSGFLSVSLDTLRAASSGEGERERQFKNASSRKEIPG